MGIISIFYVTASTYLQRLATFAIIYASHHVPSYIRNIRPPISPLHGSPASNRLFVINLHLTIRRRPLLNIPRLPPLLTSAPKIISEAGTTRPRVHT
jgi:hypothetical protein